MSVEITTGGGLVVTLEVGQGPAGPSTVAAQAAAAIAEGARDEAVSSSAAALTSQNAAAASQTAAAGSAAAALASQNAAAASQTAAAASQTAAAGSAAAALAAQLGAEAALDAFDDKYLGAKSADPLVDNDGNPLQIGAFYVNNVTGFIRVYTSAGWVQGISAIAGVSSVNGIQGGITVSVPVLRRSGTTVNVVQVVS